MSLEFFLMPDFDSTRESMGIDEHEDFDSDAILFQQGYDGEMLEIEDGEDFEIPIGYVGKPQAEVKLMDTDLEEFEQEDRDIETLNPGRYSYSEPKQTITVIEFLFSE